jgi:nucleoside-diphosphate-sugar epimerase
MSDNRETIIVTGSSGFIGYATCQRLAAEYDVVGFDRPGIPHPPPEADWVDVDLTSEESVANAFDHVRVRHGTRIAAVIHLAAYYDFSGRPSSKYEEVTVQGTARLLRHLKPFDVEQFIFSSTMLIHEPGPKGRPINEDAPIKPKWDYPRSKVKTENLIRRERGDMPTVFLRIAGVYDDLCHSIPLAHQIQRIYEGAATSHFFPGDLSHGQAFVHVEDTARLMEMLVGQRRRLPRDLALMVGERRVLSYGELQEQMGRLIHGKPWNTRRISKAFAKAGAWTQDHLPFSRDPFIKPWMIDLADDHYELDITRASGMVGWEPEHSLAAALPVMVGRLLRDPLAWYQENKLEAPTWLKKRGHRPPDGAPRRPPPSRRPRPKETAGAVPDRRRLQR